MSLAISCPKYNKVVTYAFCKDCNDELCERYQMQYKKVVIGIDQSYYNTGICIIADGEMKKLRSIQLNKYKSNSERRRVLRKTLDSLLEAVCPKSKKIICIIERIRLHSQGFLNIDYIKSIGALNSIIVDSCQSYNVPCYSVDTRCWKAQVIGTSKPATKSNKYNVPNEKWPTVQWCLKNGWEDNILLEITNRQTKGTFIRNGKKYMYNNDAADSAGIAMFGFVGDFSKLKEEK